MYKYEGIFYNRIVVFETWNQNKFQNMDLNIVQGVALQTRIKYFFTIALFLEILNGIGYQNDPYICEFDMKQKALE